MNWYKWQFPSSSVSWYLPCWEPFFPQHLCWGSPFLPPLSVWSSYCWNRAFRTPVRHKIIIVIVVVMCYTLQIADFLKGPILLGSNPILGTLKIFSINPFTFASIHLRSHQSIHVRINPFRFASIHLRSHQSIYVRINPFRFASIHLRSHQSIYVRINPFTFESIHLRSHQSIYVRINPFTFESIHLCSNQSIYVRINPFTFETIHLRSHQSIYVRINPFTSVRIGSTRRGRAQGGDSRRDCGSLDY